MFVDIPADVFEKVSTFYRHKLSRPSGDLDIHAECYTRSDISYPKFGNTGSGDIDFFFIKLPFEMSTLHREQPSISTHERVLLRKGRYFWDTKCLD